MKTINYKGYEIKVTNDGKYVEVNGVVRALSHTKQRRATKGYLQVTLHRNKKMYVHRLVAMAYIPNPNNYKQVLHIDTDTMNNHYSNLAWGESRHVHRNFKAVGRKHKVSNISKLQNKEDVEIIKQRLKNGDTLRSIAKDYNTSDMSIHRLKVKLNL